MGVPLEFKTPNTFEPVSDMIGGGSFGLKVGEWTDDTSTALCLAESLAEKGFDPVDQLERYLKWYRDGYMSVNDVCFDIGNTTREALHRFEKSHDPYCGPKSEHSAGNGSLMRLAPVPLFYISDPLFAIEKSGESSKTTHGHPLAVDACRYFGGLIFGALMGYSKEELLSSRFSPVPEYWDENQLEREIDEVASGSFKVKNPPEIAGRGYVVKCLEAALWAFYRSSSFKEGCLMAVNLGDDADTTGAVYGQIAGAYYGKSGIPENWVSRLSKLDLINFTMEKLLKKSVNISEKEL